MEARGIRKAKNQANPECFNLEISCFSVACGLKTFYDWGIILTVRAFFIKV
jgi:hypothetical protein